MTVEPINVLNEQDVSDATMKLLDALGDIPDDIAIAALADALGTVCDFATEGDRSKAFAMLATAHTRAWNHVDYHVGEVWVKRSTPKPDNVVSLPPKLDV